MAEENEGTTYVKEEHKDAKGLIGTITCTISMFGFLVYLWTRG
jgi:hypothetical protein